MDDVLICLATENENCKNKFEESFKKLPVLIRTTDYYNTNNEFKIEVHFLVFKNFSIKKTRSLSYETKIK